MIARIRSSPSRWTKVWAEVEAAWTDVFWLNITQDRLDALRLKVGPLLRFVPDVDVAAETFAHKVERLNLQNQPAPNCCNPSPKT
ncbi:MAG: hypothetical protein IPL29_16105 [Propionivibrio sp.]|nr:hypothetical protein [Propionivibrio sp.]